MNAVKGDLQICVFKCAVMVLFSIYSFNQINNYHSTTHLKSILKDIAKERRGDTYKS